MVGVVSRSEVEQGLFTSVHMLVPRQIFSLVTLYLTIALFVVDTASSLMQERLVPQASQ